LALLPFLICLASCFKYNEDNFLCTCGKVEIDKKEYIALCILPDVVTHNSVNYLRIENHTKQNISYGTYFSIEYFNDNNWEHIPFPDNWAFEDILLYTLAGETTEGVTNLYSIVEECNEGKVGRYRFKKIVGKDTGLVAEFEVK
jgi:hypothetical protein